MRIVRSLILATCLLVLVAVPAVGAEQLTMVCPVCDHVDVAGRGLEPNATLVLTITDVRTGQTVLPKTRITTDSSGTFSREFDIDLAQHPSLLGNLFEQNGNTLVLAAHTRVNAPAHCERDASLPYTGSSTGPAAAVAGGLLTAGAMLLLAARRRSGSTPA
jgi:LPXTG-motif cell wall-anchored protein